MFYGPFQVKAIKQMCYFSCEEQCYQTCPMKYALYILGLGYSFVIHVVENLSLNGDITFSLTMKTSLSPCTTIKRKLWALFFRTRLFLVYGSFEI